MLPLGDAATGPSSCSTSSFVLPLLLVFTSEPGSTSALPASTTRGPGRHPGLHRLRADQQEQGHDQHGIREYAERPAAKKQDPLVATRTPATVCAPQERRRDHCSATRLGRGNTGSAVAPHWRRRGAAQGHRVHALVDEAPLNYQPFLRQYLIGGICQLLRQHTRQALLLAHIMMQSGDALPSSSASSCCSPPPEPFLRTLADTSLGMIQQLLDQARRDSPQDQLRARSSSTWRPNFGA